MRLHVPQLQDQQTIAINGDEPWLAPFYVGFEGSGPETNRVGGSLYLKRSVDQETVEITGEIEFTTSVVCYICGGPVSHDVHATVAVSYRRIPEAVKSKKVHVLQAGELDEYYYEDDFCVDLLQVIIDAVQFELPEHPRCLEDCSDLVGIAQPDAQSSRPNPFASLANLKLDDSP